MCALDTRDAVSFDRSFGGLVRTETQIGIPVKTVYTELQLSYYVLQPGVYS